MAVDHTILLGIAAPSLHSKNRSVDKQWWVQIPVEKQKGKMGVSRAVRRVPSAEQQLYKIRICSVLVLRVKCKLFYCCPCVLLGSCSQRIFRARHYENITLVHSHHISRGTSLNILVSYSLVPRMYLCPAYALSLNKYNPNSPSCLPQQQHICHRDYIYF